MQKLNMVDADTEIYFPMKNVRYIAVNDGVDTANKNNDIAALKNVMNEFYSRDNSRKIRSSIRARAKAGLYRSSFNPIGYRKSPDNHNKLIVDEETAWIVKRIFELANAGMGAHKIATVFRKEQVPCPSWWLHSRGEKDYSKRFENPENKYEWSHTVIRNIISNPLYLGHCVMCKTESIFKVNASKKVPQEDWITVENTHEPLVAQEVFDGANEKILSRRRDITDNFVSPFAGLVKCGTCGKALTLLTSGRLNAYLADIDRQAQERMERLTEQMKRAQGITEQLKAENALEWVQRMYNIRACARGIVEREIIYT